MKKEDMAMYEEIDGSLGVAIHLYIPLLPFLSSSGLSSTRLNSALLASTQLIPLYYRVASFVNLTISGLNALASFK
ncbi:hypothetical protein GCM10008018_39980 [Paenibacillus marchantiophytorum]|uniref:Uncharacterized protein n=1 Tax=Paenibacillus marchantiophytorum TaxID=1619310 RepID=A0ABQ1EVX5_9BACL|nr:hypothetical protein GCM10008018_39980 [Paenibacillus marchantiophytorum]